MPKNKVSERGSLKKWPLRVVATASVIMQISVPEWQRKAFLREDAPGPRTLLGSLSKTLQLVLLRLPLLKRSGRVRHDSPPNLVLSKAKYKVVGLRS